MELNVRRAGFCSWSACTLKEIEGSDLDFLLVLLLALLAINSTLSSAVHLPKKKDKSNGTRYSEVV